MSELLRTLPFRVWHSPTLTTWAGFAVRFGSLLVVTPLLVTKLNPVEISAWYLFSNVLGLCMLIDLGFSPTFSRLVSFAMAGAEDVRGFGFGAAPIKVGCGPNWEIMGRLYQTMRYVYLVLGGALAVLLATLGTFSVAHVISQLDQPADGWGAWAILAATAVINFTMARYACCLNGMNQVALTNRWQAFWGLVSIASAFAVLSAGGKLIALVLAYQLPQTVGSWLMRAVLFKQEHGEFKQFSRWLFDRELFRVAWAPAWRSAIGIAGSTGVAQAISVIYAQVSAPQMLANFLFTQRLITTAASFSQAPFYAHIPRYARLRAEGRLPELAALTARSIERSLLAFIGASLFIVTLGNGALALIKANVQVLDGWFWLVWMLIYLLERHHAMHAQIYSTTNHIPFYVPICISGVVNLALAYLLLPITGVWAFLIGQGASNLLINNWWNVQLSLRSLPRDSWRYFRRPAALASLAMVASVIIEYLYHTLLLR